MYTKEDLIDFAIYAVEKERKKGLREISDTDFEKWRSEREEVNMISIYENAGDVVVFLNGGSDLLSLMLAVALYSNPIFKGIVSDGHKILKKYNKSNK